MSNNKIKFQVLNGSSYGNKKSCKLITLFADSVYNTSGPIYIGVILLIRIQVSHSEWKTVCRWGSQKCIDSYFASHIVCRGIWVKLGHLNDEVKELCWR